MSVPTNEPNPLTGDDLETALSELNDPDFKFFDRLTAVVYHEARRRGLMDILPGAMCPDDIAVKVIDSILMGRRKWDRTINKSFFSVCEYNTRSILGHWCEKVDNTLELNQFDSGFEELAFGEDQPPRTTEFPSSDESTPSESIQATEITDSINDALLMLIDEFPQGSMECKILDIIFEDHDYCGRGEIISRLGCSGPEFDKAIKRIQRKASKQKPSTSN